MYSCFLGTDFVVLFLIFFKLAQAQDLHLACASNFQQTLHKISQKFEIKTGRKVLISAAASGTLYAQIKNGAPFDIFFSADQFYPAQLVRDNLAENPKSYARGELVLWGDPELFPTINMEVLVDQKIKHIAIANPDLAPYGKAAKEYLVTANLWDKISSKIVYANNISQAMVFAHSGATQLSFVSLAQVLELPVKKQKSFIVVPASTKLVQDLVVLKKAKKIKLAKEFVQFFESVEIRSLLEKSGYFLP